MKQTEEKDYVELYEWLVNNQGLNLKKDASLEEMKQTILEMERLTFDVNVTEDVHLSFDLLINLKRLTVCEFKRNFMDYIGYFQKLEQLHFMAGGLKDKHLPDAIGQLPNLRILEITEQVSEIPESIGNLINLETLKILDGTLAHLPKSFTKLQNLKYLSLRCGNLRELPKDIDQLQNLTELRIENSQLSIIPPVVRSLQKTVIFVQK